jgi:hypothetical protein
MLPPLVDRYAERAIDGGHPIGGVKIQLRCEMTLKPGATPRQFTAVETLAPEAITFCWKAPFPILGPLAMHVTGLYDGTLGGLEVRVLGLPVQRRRGPEIAEGEVFRHRVTHGQTYGPHSTVLRTGARQAYETAEADSGGNCGARRSTKLWTPSAKSGNENDASIRRSACSSASLSGRASAS